MGWFRNPELRLLLPLYLLAAAISVGGGFWAGGLRGVGAALLSLFLLTGLFALQTGVRYRQIRAFSHDIDRILHGAEKVQWEHYAEGELAILQNEIRKLTLELRDQAGALQQDKRQLADFLADISHQLRTPLTSINLIISMLGKHDLPEEERLRSMRELQKLLQRMDWLIQSLLKMSRLDSNTAYLQKTPVSVSRLIEKAAEALAVPMDLRGQELILQIAEGAGFAGDFAWSCEAVGNILKNCMEHTPPGGAIRVEASENALFCEILISDNGSGIDPQDLPHLFERFYRGRDAGEQSIGFGLALSRMIVSRQNGTIRAENLPEGGARFILRFYKDII